MANRLSSFGPQKIQRSLESIFQRARRNAQNFSRLAQRQPLVIVQMDGLLLFLLKLIHPIVKLMRQFLLYGVLIWALGLRHSRLPPCFGLMFVAIRFPTPIHINMMSDPV